MGFVCTIEEKLDVHVMQKGSACIAAVAIGYDDEDDLDYSVVAGVEEVPGETEFYFAIVEANNNNGQEYFYFDGKYTTSFISKPDRELILSVILAASECVISQAQPKRFFRCCYEPDLPDKALAKHNLLTKVFEGCGYHIVRTDPYHHGKRIWVMERA